MVHTDSSGAVTTTHFASNGRVIRSFRSGVPAVAFTAATGLNTPAQIPIFTEYTYTSLASNNSQKALYELATTTIARTGESETSPAVAGGWSRTVRERYDGAGRTVYTKDLPGTENTITYPTDQATAAVVFRYLGPAVGAAGTEMEKSVSFLDGLPKERTGSAVIAEYYDYATAAGQSTTWRSPYSPAVDGPYTTVDSMGRSLAGTLPTPWLPPDPHSTAWPQATDFFNSTITYDSSGNVTSRKLPGAPLDYYEVFQTEYSAPDWIVSRALSTDAAYDAAGQNQSRTRTRYANLGGVWYEVSEWQTGSNWETASWTRRALGPISGTSLTWNALQWTLTSLTQTYSGGALRQTAHYVEPTAGQTLMQPAVDGVVQQSIASRAGRALFFQTPRYERLLSYSPLGEPLSEPAADHSQWTNRNLTAATGQVASVTTPNSSEIKESYVYYPANDRRSGLLKQKTASYTGTTPVTYYDYNNRGQLTHRWGGGDYPAFYDYDTLGRMTTLQWTAPGPPSIQPATLGPNGGRLPKKPP